MLLDSRNFTQYLTRHEIEGIVEDLGKQISADYAGQKVVLIGVLKGVIMFMADLVRQIQGVDLEIDFVRLSSYGRGLTSSGTVTMLKDIQIDIRGKNVLIVEEVIDSGRTLRFLYERLLKADPLSVEIVTLLDKPARRVVKVPVKYVGHKSGDHFLVGYGLDLEEECRNIPDIFYLKYPN